MFIVCADFPDGSFASFSSLTDLYIFMMENGHNSAFVRAYHAISAIAPKDMGIKMVGKWIDIMEGKLHDG